jgi:hypothetical protein
LKTHEDFGRHDEVRGPSDRSFGVVFVVVFALIGMWPLLHGAPARRWALAICAGLALISAAQPRLLHPANVVWMRFGMLLSKVMNPVVTGLVFYLVVTPIGLLMRVLGKAPLPLGYDRQASSYWIDRRPPGPKPESMSHQF